MADNVNIQTEEDQSLLVQILSTTLKRSALDFGLRSKMAGLKGTFALQSKLDPQAATISFNKGNIMLRSGIVGTPDVKVTVDINNMSGPNADKPKVVGAAKHPLFALAVSKCLEPPVTSWQAEVKKFWAFAHGAKFGPTGLKVVCLDDGESVSVGEGKLVEVHASKDELIKVFTGGAVFAQEALDGKLFVIGDLPEVAVLTGRSIDYMMGKDLV